MKQFLIALALVALAGCGPKLQAVKAFSDTAMSVNSQANEVITDFYTSCERRVTLVEKAQAKNEIEKLPEDSPVTVDAYIQLSVSKKCSKHKLSTEGLKSALQIMNNYLSAVGSLASDTPVKYDATLSGVKETISSAVGPNNQPLFTDQEKINGLFSLADFVIGAGIHYYQKKELDKYLAESGDNVLAVYAAIIRVIETNYIKELEAELSANKNKRLREKRRPLSKQLKAGNLSQEEYNVLVYLLNEDFSREKQIIESKMADARRVVVNLKLSQATLQSIQKSSGTLDSEFIIKQVNDYYTTVLPSLKAVGVIH